MQVPHEILSADRPPLIANIAIIEARYYTAIADHLAQGALEVLNAAGVAHARIDVPGALEIPLAAKLAREAGYDGVVALGCVIRGETTHYDIVAEESARGLAELSRVESFPIGNAILTVEDMAQALARAEVARGNKGGFAAAACLRMIALKRAFPLVSNAAKHG